MQQEVLDKKIAKLMDWMYTMYVRDGGCSSRVLIITKAGNVAVFDTGKMAELSPIYNIDRLLTMVRPMRDHLAACIIVCETKSTVPRSDKQDLTALVVCANGRQMIWQWPMDLSGIANSNEVNGCVVHHGKVSGMLGQLFAETYPTDPACRMSNVCRDIVAGSDDTALDTGIGLLTLRCIE